MKVTVFGGANPKPGDQPYQEARLLGRLLGEAGHTVLTGGYVGTMEAASRGAAEAGAHVIGVTCKEIEQYRSGRANAWVKEEWYLETLDERLIALIRGSDAAIALPGGAGTLTEIAMVWNLLIIHSLSPRPLILVGEGWKGVFETFFAKFAGYVFEKDQKIIRFAANVEDALKLLVD